jgi:hypothetical protein
MKKNLLNLSLIAIASCAFVGCAPVTVAMRDVATQASIKQGDIIEFAITAAREVGFPPATKIDKENGLVEFGGYGTTVMGITAQVRVKSSTEVEVTVKRLSVYIPLGVDKQADAFTARLKEHLGEAAVKVVH